MRRQVAVVGGGIAGLTLAAALDPRRFAVTVHEAEPERAGAGFALGLWPAALRALSRIGAREAVAALGHRPPGAGLHTIAGRRLLPLGSPPLIMVQRPDLLAALRAAVPSEVRMSSGEVSDPAALDADLVIGADGVRSRVRPLVQPSAAERLPTPYVALRGLTTLPVRVREIGEYWGRGRLFGIVPAGPSGAYWFTSHRSALGPEPLDPEVVLAEARAVFATAAPIVRTVLDRAGPEVSATRIWTAPPMRRYVRGRYAVIGDAAHAMTPNLGRGACEAIIDAVTLAAAMERGTVATWQARRVPLTQGYRVASGALMRLALQDLRRQ